MTAAVPDPRDTETLREALRAHHPIMRSETGPFSGCRCGQVKLGQDVIAHVVAHLHAALAAEVEARVQAAANQRAAEVGRCGDEAPSMVGGSVEWCRLPAGHLGWHRGDNGGEWTHGAASPAPAPRAEEGQR